MRILILILIAGICRAQSVTTFILSSAPVGASPAVAYDTSKAIRAYATSAALTLTIGSNSNRGIVAYAERATSYTIDSIKVTSNGAKFTLFKRIQTDNSLVLEGWRLVNPPTGLQTFTEYISTTNNAQFSVTSLYNVNQTTPILDSAGAYVSTGDSIGVAITVGDGNMAVAGYYDQDSTYTYTYSTGETARASSLLQGSGDASLTSSTKPGAATIVWRKQGGQARVGRRIVVAGNVNKAP